MVSCSKQPEEQNGRKRERVMDGMETALREAEEAIREGEVPVGAALYCGEELVWADHNRREQLHDPTAHAEMLCLRNGAKVLGDWRLGGCTLYVTLEPCPMCAGALAWAQIGKVVYGASDPKRGFSMFSPSLLHPKTETVSGVMADECGELVTEFFKKKRS